MALVRGSYPITQTQDARSASFEEGVLNWLEGFPQTDSRSQRPIQRTLLVRKPPDDFLQLGGHG